MSARRRRRSRQAEPREVTIESMSHEGRGIAHVNGKTVFVFGALLGEKVLIQIQRSSRKFDQATTLEVIESSPQRIEPRCAAFQVCGGCSLQHLDNEDQLVLKQQALLDMMKHAHIDFGKLIPALRADAWGYRKKARLGVKYVEKKGRVLVGFRERNTPFIADMLRCEVLLPEVGHKLDQLSELIGQLEARAQIPQIEVAADNARVQLVFRHLQSLDAHDQKLLADFGAEHGYLIQLQPGGPASVHNLYPEEQSLSFDPLGDGSLSIAFGALDFVQVNTVINTVNTALGQLGADNRSLDNQDTFLSEINDALEEGVGTLVDADLAKESARLQALQVKQQLSVQTLSIANSSPQILLGLFN